MKEWRQKWNEASKFASIRTITEIERNNSELKNSNYQKRRKQYDFWRFEKHPPFTRNPSNLNKAIDYLYQHRKDSFELGKYEIDEGKVFLVVQENVLNQAENDQFEHHKNYADLHLLSRRTWIFELRFTYQVNSSIRRRKKSGLSIVLPSCLGYRNFAVFPGEPHQPNGYAGMEEKVRKYLFKILID